MNEADRCDRISLMHAGKVLAVGTPQELVRKRGSPSLEDAFISYLAEAAGIKLGEKAPPPAQGAATPAAEPKPHGTRRFDLGRLWAYARRETMELLCDSIRLAFAAFGPLILMIAFGYGISLDVENLRFGAFDQDRPREPDFDRGVLFGSALLRRKAAADRLQQGSRPPLPQRRPPGRRRDSPAYGRDLQNGRVPEVAVWVDGSMPFRGETTKGYVTALATADADVDPGHHVHHRRGARSADRRLSGGAAESPAGVVQLETRVPIHQFDEFALSRGNLFVTRDFQSLG